MKFVYTVFSYSGFPMPASFASVCAFRRYAIFCASVLMVCIPSRSLFASSAVYANTFVLIIAAVCPFSFLEMTCMIGVLRAGGDGKTGLYSDIVIM